MKPVESPVRMHDLSAASSSAVRVSTGRSIPIFSFDDIIDYLNFEFRNRQNLDPRFSLRSWSKSLGYRNPSYLSQVLRRQRKLKPDLAQRLAYWLHLEGRELRYYEHLVMRQTYPDAPTYGSLSRPPRAGKVARPYQSLTFDLFLLVSDWYHNALLEMPQLRDFRPDVSYLRKRLGNKVSAAVIARALERLVRHGLLEKGTDGTLRRPASANNLFDSNIPSEAVRSHHKQWIEKAKASVDEQSMQERDLFSTTMSFRLPDMPKAREIIREAHRKLLQLEAARDGDELYQFNTQFFAITRSLRKREQLQ